MFALIGKGDYRVYVNTRHVKYATPMGLRAQIFLTEDRHLVVDDKFEDVCLKLEIGNAVDEGETL